MPDYYVTHCQSCNEKFSYSLRKHHCRNCGQVFCYKCADQFYPLPNHNLTAPVRICHSCKSAIDKDNSSKTHFNANNSNNSNQSHFKQQHTKHHQQNQVSNFNSSTLIFSSTPPNFNSDLFSSTNFKFDKFNHSNASSNANYNEANSFSAQPTKLLNPINLHKSSNQQQQQQQQQLMSYSTSPTHPLAFTYPSQKSTANLSNTSSTSSNCNISIGSRCNQLESNKFKKNGSKTQKVSV